MDYVLKSAGGAGRVHVSLVDQGYEYKDACLAKAPFPCNVFYDLKAWDWLSKTVEVFHNSSILFWNIGA